MPQAVIFDVDGTLVDSVDLHARAWADTFRHFGHDVPFDEVRAQIGKGADQLMPVFLSRRELDEKGDEIETFRTDLYKRDHLGKVRGFPNVRELFEALRARGRRLLLASSAKGDELETYVRVAGIDGLFDDATTSEDADRSKPHPDIFAAALEKAGLPPSAAVVVGDTPYDAEAAVKAGITPIGVRSGGFPVEDLRGAGCVEIWDDPADLLRNLDRSLIGRG